jgi:hypothetical protein
MVKVKIGLSGPSILCENYIWEKNGIVLLNAHIDGSIWEQVEIFNTSATIMAFKGETKLVEEKPW